MLLRRCASAGKTGVQGEDHPSPFSSQSLSRQDYGMQLFFCRSLSILFLHVCSLGCSYNVTMMMIMMITFILPYRVFAMSGFCFVSVTFPARDVLDSATIVVVLNTVCVACLCMPLMFHCKDARLLYDGEVSLRCPFMLFSPFVLYAFFPGLHFPPQLFRLRMFDSTYVEDVARLFFFSFFFLFAFLLLVMFCHVSSSECSTLEKATTMVMFVSVVFCCFFCILFCSLHLTSSSECSTQR